MNKRDRTPYLEKRGDAFYFRRRLPYESNSLSNPFLIFSLRTDVPSDAREITARLTAMTTLAYDYARGCPSMGQNTLKPLLTNLVRFEIAAFEKSRLATGPRSLAAAEFASEREQAIQETLRQAIFLRNWEAIRSPLECVATRLGITLPADPLTYATLALEALKVSIDISRERQNRDRGEYTDQTVIFSHAIRTDGPTPSELPKPARPTVALDTAFAVTAAHVQEPSVQSTPVKSEPPSMLPPRNIVLEQNNEPLSVIAPAKSDVREILRSKNLLRFCTDESIALLEKGNDITIHEAFDIYIDFKEHGCSDEWEQKQKPDAISGKNWKRSSLPNLKTAKALWTDLLNNESVGLVREEDVDETITTIRKIPKNHGKWEGVRANDGYHDLIKRANKDENRSMDNVERELRQSGCTNEEEIRDARLSKCIPRIPDHAAEASHETRI